MCPSLPPRSDIVGFSGIASRCSAREVCDMLNSLYVRFDALIESPTFAEAGIYKARSSSQETLLPAV